MSKKQTIEQWELFGSKRAGYTVRRDGVLMGTFTTESDAMEYVEKTCKFKVERIVVQGNHFKGKNVVVTGRMPRSRAVIEDELTRVGANVQKAVSGYTDYLICGADVGERKTRAAEAKGIPMLNRDDYRKIMAGGTIGDAAPTVVKPKMTHDEFVASLPEEYGSW